MDFYRLVTLCCMNLLWVMYRLSGWMPILYHVQLVVQKSGPACGAEVAMTHQVTASTSSLFVGPPLIFHQLGLQKNTESCVSNKVLRNPRHTVKVVLSERLGWLVPTCFGRRSAERCLRACASLSVDDLKPSLIAVASKSCISSIKSLNTAAEPCIVSLYWPGKCKIYKSVLIGFW
jgi:hypothetical protein